MAQTTNADDRMLMVLLRAGIMGEVPDTLPKGADMTQVYRLSARQNVLALAQDGVSLLQRHFNLGMTEKTAMSWGIATLNTERRYERHRRVIMALRDFYAKHGIRMMVLKGWSVSLLYPTPSHRPGGDIDIYLYGDYMRADALIESEKHTPVTRDHHHHTIFHVGDTMIENHYDFIDVTYSPNAMLLEEHLKRLAAEEAETHEGVCLPPPTFYALFLLRHAAQHFAGEHIELRHLTDWHMLRQRLGNKVRWHEVADIAKQMGLQPFMQCLDDACEALFCDKQLSGMSLKVWNDIWHPEFNKKRPRENTPADWVFRARRWYHGLWKRKLVYPYPIWRQFVTLAWSHIKKPDIPAPSEEHLTKNT